MKAQEDWKWVQLENVGEIETGTTPSKKKLEYYGEDYPFFKPTDLNNGKNVRDAREYLSKEGLNKARLLPKGSTLVTCIGATIGKTGMIQVDGASNQQINAIIPFSALLPEFVYYQVIGPRIQEDIKAKASATTLPILNKSKFKELFFAVPPLPEQHAIVSKIEQLFSKLDNGIANLKLAQEQLKVYRQAVLKKAFEGELTKKWREQQTDLPDAEDLLQQIRKERDESSKTSGKKVKPLNPLSKEELAELARLPRGWKWVKIGDVSNCLDSQRVPVNKSDRIKRTGNIPYYGANGQVGWIDDYLFDEPLVLVVEDETFTGREKPFSYLITGKSWVNNHAHILQPTSGLDVDFLNYQLSYYPFTPLTTGTTGRKKLTQFALTNAPFKICSLPEQQAIVQEIETRLSVCDKIEKDIETNLEKAEALRQSILKKAFEGKLLNERELAEVRRAEDWEPAEVLLEKIKAERIGNGKNGRAQ